MVHLVISGGIGLVFGVVTGAFAGRLGPVLGAGALYGMGWWALGPLVLMPATLGMPLFTIDQSAMMSLIGHVIYGLVTAVGLFFLSHRSA